jgi:flagellar biosynthesis/type III secretory pathway protein FliH
MDTNFHDFFIDKALEFKDYEWLQKLQKQKSEQLDRVTPNNKFIKSDTIVENINQSYAIKDKNGLRNLNWSSDYDIECGEIVQLEKESYKKYDIARYRDLNELESYYIRGYIKGCKETYINYYNQIYNQGYVQGYSEGAKISEKTIEKYTNFTKDLNKTIKESMSKLNQKKWYEFWK